ncbi:MAG: CPXCG motif-containing cysteine-rich protein [Acidobacteriota bacterium]
MHETATYRCPSCGEAIEIAVDPSAGRLQEYVEDCSVCCRPNVLRIEFDGQGRARVEGRPE